MHLNRHFGLCFFWWLWKFRNDCEILWECFDSQSEFTNLDFSFIFEDVRWIQTTFPKICWGFICKFANLWRRALNTNCPHLVWGAIGLLWVKIDSNLCPKSVLWAQRMLLFSLPDSLVLPHIVRRHMYSAITSPPQLWMDIVSSKSCVFLSRACLTVRMWGTK